MTRLHRLASVLLALPVALGVLTANPPAGASSEAGTLADQPWRDRSLPPGQRAELLLDALTFHDKVQIALDDFSQLGAYGLPTVLKSHDGPSGVSVAGATAFPAALGLAATFSTDLAEQYGAAIAEEIRSFGAFIWLGPATDIARQPLSGRLAENLGEDPHLVGQIARAEVDGATSRNVMTTIKHFGANVQEYARMGFVSEDTSDFQAAIPICAQPPVCVTVPVGYRTPAIDERISERALKEIYEPAVITAVEDGGAGSVMCAYNRVNGLPACQNKQLLDSLRDAFDGLIIPDFLVAQRDPVAAALAGVDIAGFDGGNQQRTRDMYLTGAIPETVLDNSTYRILYALFSSGAFDYPARASSPISTAPHRRLATEVAARSMVLLKNAGGVLPLSRSTDRSVAIIGPSRMDAIFTEGGLGPSVPNTAETTVTPLDGLKKRAGRGTDIEVAQGSAGDLASETLVPGAWTQRVWDNMPEPEGPPTSTSEVSSIDYTAEGVQAARWTAQITPPESGVYRFTSLVSGDMTLRIDGKTVIDARKPTSDCGGSRNYPSMGLARLRAERKVRVQVDYSSVSNTICVVGHNINLGWETPSESGIPAAVKAARRTDVAVVMVNAASGEGSDRNSLSLPGDQDRLIEAVSRVNDRTVVVLNTAGPVLMPWLGDVEGVVQAWYPGQTFGTALARVLYGDLNPSGRLPMTFPAHAFQGPTPAVADALVGGPNNVLKFKEGIFVGYRWYDRKDRTPLFPFGHGLSYTSFRYSNLSVSPRGDHATVAVTVTNTGGTNGTVVPQFYLGRPSAKYGVPFAAKSLVGFADVRLRPGRSKRVTIEVDRQQLRYWDSDRDNWRVASAGRTISVGNSVRDIRGTVPFSLDRRGS